MKLEKKTELKGMLKGVIVTLLLLGVFIGGIAYATVVITDEGVWVDNNEVIVEGDYTTWTHKWTNEPPNGATLPFITNYIDEKNDVITILWRDDSSDDRIGTFTLEDFSVVTLPVGDYMSGPPLIETDYSLKSLETYLLMRKDVNNEFEVWRGGSPLWSLNITDDVPGATEAIPIISLSGKYILFFTNNNKLALYEGS